MQTHVLGLRLQQRQSFVFMTPVTFRRHTTPGIFELKGGRVEGEEVNAAHVRFVEVHSDACQPTSKSRRNTPPPMLLIKNCKAQKSLLVSEYQDTIDEIYLAREHTTAHWTTHTASRQQWPHVKMSTAVRTQTLSRISRLRLSRLLETTWLRARHHPHHPNRRKFLQGTWDRH